MCIIEFISLTTIRFKKFHFVARMNIHRLKHSNIKFVCETCNFECASKTSLALHSSKSRIKFVMSLDLNSLIRFLFLERHNRTDADRKYACEYCELKFFELRTMKKHQAVHTGKRRKLFGVSGEIRNTTIFR